MWRKPYFPWLILSKERNMKTFLNILVIVLTLSVATMKLSAQSCVTDVEATPWYGQQMQIDTCNSPLFYKKLAARYNWKIVNEEWADVLELVKKDMKDNDTLRQWRNGTVLKKYMHLLDRCIEELEADQLVNSTSLSFQSDGISGFYIGQRDASFTDTISFTRTNTEFYQITLLLQWNKAVREILLKRISNEVKIQFDHIDQAEKRYYNYLFKGMFQYPWEAFLNDLVYSRHIDQNGPSTQQLIIAHPSIVMQVRPDRLENVFKEPVINEALSVDVIGYVWYYSHFKHYFAISAPVNFRSDMGAGPGIKLHFSRFNIGANWHDTDGKKGLNAIPLVSLSMNLFKKYQENRKKADDLLSSFKDKTGKE